jgi:uncharacterized protein YbjT (DUF2867 family)
MKILLTGASGYIGSRLLPILLGEGHEVIVLVRRPVVFDVPQHLAYHITTIQGDLLNAASLEKIPKDIDAAYYLVHSMSRTSNSFSDLEKLSATNFVEAMKLTRIKQIIFLSGISHGDHLSEHLTSRKAVEEIIKNSGIVYTVLRAAIIIGSGSASFGIIRDLVEKLPILITPRWVNNKTQPIAISDVLFYLRSVLNLPAAFNRTFEIGGPDQLTYQEMLNGYARIRKLKRWFINVPVLTPRLSSYWLYFVTSTNYALAKSLVDSLRNETTCTDFSIQSLIPHTCLTYEEAIRQALTKIE